MTLCKHNCCYVLIIQLPLDWERTNHCWSAIWELMVKLGKTNGVVATRREEKLKDVATAIPLLLTRKCQLKELHLLLGKIVYRACLSLCLRPTCLLPLRSEKLLLYAILEYRCSI